MIRLLTIIGARPQIIKAAAISRAIHNRYSGQVSEHILHTGQHYDTNMSEVFFRELGIPEPDYNLHVGSGSHGVQTARIMEGVEHVLTDTHYDGVVVYGDTNSTLAAAVAATKIHVPVFHIEAGLRSFNMAMPEEINRIVCDQLSSVLFTPTLTGKKNLEEEGFDGIKSRVRFADGRGQKVILSGDVMYDNSMYFSSKADTQSDIIERLGLSYRGFVLATIHRPANTDKAENLQSIFRALLDIAENEQTDVVLPLHPRTRKMLPVQLSKELLERVEKSNRFRIIEPASFFEIIRLEKNARVVMTDSGGVQKESFFYGTPCVILRPETEWVEIVDAGAGIIADADYARIIEAYKILSDQTVHFPPLFGDGHASEKIIDEIIHYLQ
ncbi:MAG: UDP-N-acetylglucosamine 2-epimerase (non-hydrolyzing) [Paludibacteraceae bacterium]|nr:UDP-N-acetylglucosamine 2-epimerase (non-hydrolyzing) [Paludibacteraceae bacterium]MBR0064449.1 UDP-N-acetylglucosamine 2-epimerase (non-hydrolyzing) [Paludibacteraceae bacterium]